MKGRPEKEGVDYFPHAVKHGETMFFLEKQFGNDGYAAWFKILETLGSKKEHALFCNGNSYTWEYLKAKTGLDDIKLTGIVDLLAVLGAIDKDLWSKDQTIWSSHLAENLKPVYIKRGKELPCKPIFCSRKELEPTFSEPESPQVKERKEKGSREEKKYIDPHLGQFKNVKLSIEEFEKLKSQFGETEALERIDRLSEYIASKGVKYKSHYATILSWARKEGKHGDKKTDSAVSRGLARFLAEETEP